MSQNTSANVPSDCLTQEENDLLFTLIGNRKQTKASAVVQLFQANPDRTQWTKFKTGVVCFVKDNVKKSYYIRLFDLSVSIEGLATLLSKADPIVFLTLVQVHGL